MGFESGGGVGIIYEPVAFAGGVPPANLRPKMGIFPNWELFSDWDTSQNEIACLKVGFTRAIAIREDVWWPMATYGNAMYGNASYGSVL